MKKVVLVYSLLSLVILTGVGIVVALTTDHSVIAGFAAMIAALSMIFFAMRSYRDQHLGGTITFGQAFKIGIVITLIASLFYVVGWEIYSSNYLPTFMDDYSAREIAKLQQEGLSTKEYSEEVAKIEWWRENYKNPIFRFPMVFMEIFPVGLLITLLSAYFVRTKKRVTQAVA